MRSSYCLLILASVLLFSCGESKQVNTDIGKQVYETNCAACHGVDGKLGLNGSKDLTKSIMSLEDKIARINEGKSPMPPYKNLLKKEEIEAVAIYIGKLK
jgi:mono/diheme cytochrome c family protein